MLFEKVVAAATCIAGYKFNDDETWETSPYPRVITHVGLSGSTAIGDTEIEIYVSLIVTGKQQL